MSSSSSNDVFENCVDGTSGFSDDTTTTTTKTTLGDIGDVCLPPPPPPHLSLTENFGGTGGSGEITLPLNDVSVMIPTIHDDEEEEEEQHLQNNHDEQGNDNPFRPLKETRSGEEELLPPPPPPSGGGATGGRPLVTPTFGGGGGNQHDLSLAGSDAPSDLGFVHHRGGGFNLRHYEEDLDKLRKDNLNLKLRIYLLEERHGLLPATRPEEKENVFRINLDLRVQNEELKRGIDEKTELLAEAFDALKNQEAEQLRERSDYASQINSLKQSLLDSQFTIEQSQSCNYAATAVSQTDRICGGEMENESPLIGERSQALLFEAFGSMNLGKPGDLLGRVEELEAELAEKNEHVRELQEDANEANRYAESKEDELAKETQAFDKMTKEFRARIVHLEAALESSVGRDSLMETELLRIREHLDERGREMSLVAAERDGLNARVAELLSLLERKKEEIGSLEERLTKSQICLVGVSEANVIQSKEKEKLDKAVAKRDQALEILTKEYEVVKTKIRQYRAQGMQSDAGGGDNSSTALGRRMAELEEAKSRESSLKSEMEQLRAAAAAAAASSDRPSGWQREIDMLKAELRSCRASATKRGAKKALDKAHREYKKAAESYSSGMRSSFDTLRKRLEELADFLQELVAMDGGNLSMMSNSVRELIHRSLEESRRMSQSLSQSMMAAAVEDANETQRSSVNEMPPLFSLPEVEVSLDEDADEEAEARIQEYEALILELKDNVRQRIDAQKETEQLRMKLSEVDKAGGRGRSRSLSRRRPASSQGSVEGHHQGRGDSDAWFQPDASESRKRMAGLARSKIPIILHSGSDHRGVSSSVAEADSSSDASAAHKFKKTRAKVVQLRARLASQEERSERDNGTVTKQLEEAKSLVDALKEEKKNLTAALAAIKADLDENIASVMEELTKVSDANARLTKKVRTLKEGRESAAMEKDKLREAVAAKEEMLLELEAKSASQLSGLQSRIDDLVGQNEALCDKLRTVTSSAAAAVFVSKENFEEHEMALGGRGAPRRVPLIAVNGNLQSGRRKQCDCQTRIDELERLLAETKTLLDDATEKIRAEKERKQKLERAARRQLEKTKRVLLKTTKDTPPVLAE